MLDKEDFKKTIDEIVTNENFSHLTDLLNKYFQDNQFPHIVSLLRVIRYYDYPSITTEENIIRSILDVTKNWKSKGYPFTQSNIISLLFQSTREGKLTKSLHKILIADINNNILNISDLVDFFLQFCTQSENEQLALYILEKCEQKEFDHICSQVAKNKWNDKFAKFMQQNQSRFKFSLPQTVIDLAEGTSKKQKKIPNNPVPVESKKLVSPVTKETMGEKILKMPKSASNYIDELEKYIDQTCSDQSYRVADSSVIKEYEQLLADLVKRQQANYFSIADIKNKERMLKLSYKYKHEDFAKKLGAAIGMSKDKMIWLAVKYCCNDLLTELLKDISNINIFITDKNKYNLLHMAARGELKTIKILIEGLGSENIKKLINESNYWGNTPVHILAGRGSEFDEVVKWFAELGGNFKIKNNDGQYPAQSKFFQCSPTRVEFYKQIGITNLRTLESAIVNNDLDSVIANIHESSIAKLQSVFAPKTQQEGIKVPIHKDVGWGSMLHSMYRPYSYHAIYNGHFELIQLLIVKILMDRKIFEPNLCLEELNRLLDYTNELVEYRKFSNNASKYCDIKIYLEKMIRYGTEKVDEANNNSISNFNNS